MDKIPMPDYVKSSYYKIRGEILEHWDSLPPSMQRDYSNECFASLYPDRMIPYPVFWEEPDPSGRPSSLPRSKVSDEEWNAMSDEQQLLAVIDNYYGIGPELRSESDLESISEAKEDVDLCLGDYRLRKDVLKNPAMRSVSAVTDVLWSLQGPGNGWPVPLCITFKSGEEFVPYRAQKIFPEEGPFIFQSEIFCTGAERNYILYDRDTVRTLPGYDDALKRHSFRWKGRSVELIPWGDVESLDYYGEAFGNTEKKVYSGWKGMERFRIVFGHLKESVKDKGFFTPLVYDPDFAASSGSETLFPDRFSNSIYEFKGSGHTLFISRGGLCSMPGFREFYDSLPERK